MLINFIIWNPKPEIFSLGSFAVRWYGLFFVIAFYLSYIFMNKFFKKENFKNELLDKLTMYMLIATILGARLGHCFFYDFKYYISHPLEILYVWHGGLASHGAAIAILIALYLYSRKVTEITYVWLLDRIVIMVALSGFFIRMGNLMNSEIYGHQTSLPWGFVFVANGELFPKHPTQIYEALGYLLLFFVLLGIYYKKDGKPRPGFIFSVFLIALFTIRFLIEFIKEPQSKFEENMVLNMGQLLSAPFILAGIILLYFVLKKNDTVTPEVQNVISETEAE